MKYLCIGQHLFHHGIARSAKDCQSGNLRFPLQLAQLSILWALIDLSHQAALKACLITVTNRLGTHTVCLEKLLSSSENLDKEIGLFKPLKGMIKTVLLELGDIFDSSWNRPITEHSATELLLIIVKNPVRIWVCCAMKLPSYRRAQHWSESVTIKFFRVNVTGRRHLDWHCRARIVENWVRYYLLRSAVNKKYVYILAVISLSVWCMTWWLSLSKLPKLWCFAFKPVTWGSEKATQRKGKKGYVILKSNILVEIPLRRKTGHCRGLCLLVLVPPLPCLGDHCPSSAQNLEGILQSPEKSQKRDRY